MFQLVKYRTPEVTTHGVSLNFGFFFMITVLVTQGDFQTQFQFQLSVFPLVAGFTLGGYNRLPKRV